MARFPNTTGVPNLFVQETAKEVQSQLLHLIVVSGIKNETSTEDDLYLVDSNFDVTYAGIEYRSFPLQFSGVNISTDGTIDKASITVSNVSRVLMPLIEEYDGLAGCAVSVITVYEKFLDFTYVYSADGTLTTTSNTDKDATLNIRDEYVIDSYSANDSTISFQLSAVIDFTVKVPRRRFTPYNCYWRYKDPDTCGYPNTCVGTTATPVPDTTLTTCDKSITDCAAHCNSARYGGFPGIPNNVRRLFLSLMWGLLWAGQYNLWAHYYS